MLRCMEVAHTMYDGYRIKINGVILPNEYIIATSWSNVYGEKRKLEEYNDAYGERHTKYAEHVRTSISFHIIERDVVKNLLIMPFFESKEHVLVEYYNDLTGTYETGDFSLNDPKIETKYVNDNTIWYKETAIEYEEY